MQRVADGWRQYHLGVAGQLQGTATFTMIGQMQAAQLDVVFGRYDDLGVTIEVQLTHLELCPGITKDRFLALGLVQGRLMGGRPVDTAGHVAQVTEYSQVVTGDILTPTRHRQVIATAVTTACVVDHYMVAAIGE
ncbi:hypothetical protein D3C77_319000 [compost metagenome]